MPAVQRPHTPANLVKFLAAWSLPTCVSVEGGGRKVGRHGERQPLQPVCCTPARPVAAEASNYESRAHPDGQEEEEQGQGEEER